VQVFRQACCLYSSNTTPVQNITLVHASTLCRWERSGFDAAYGKLSDQLQNVTAEVDAVVSGINVAHTAERHATAETEVLKAQGDSEQVALLFWLLSGCLHQQKHACHKKHCKSHKMQQQGHILSITALLQARCKEHVQQGFCITALVSHQTMGANLPSIKCSCCVQLCFASQGTSPGS